MRFGTRDTHVPADRGGAAGGESQTRFFRRFRRICLIGYYPTPTGVAELGYIGYPPSARFAGPPPPVLAMLGDEPGV